MRNSAGEQAELFQSLGFASFGFIALTFGDIAKNKNDAATSFLLSRMGEATCSIMCSVPSREVRVAFSGSAQKNRCASLRKPALARGPGRPVDRDIEESS